MRNIFFVFLFVMVAASLQAQQNVLLYADTFTANSSPFILSSNQLGAAAGNNKWVINKSYSGAPVYGNTPGQNNVVSGTINGAPNSYYLHIHNEAAFISDNVSNANWNPADASSQFAVLDNNFCTLGIQDVAFTFFWIGQGNADAYGEVYYRRNGGAWTKTGQAKYNNQPIWKYEAIQDTGFNNAGLLQFGFRWVNNATGTANVSFGIDDIVIVGTFSPGNAAITISQLTPTSICQNNTLSIGYTLSNTLCDGSYQIQMSDSSGSFTSPYNGGVFSVLGGDTAGFTSFQVPDNVAGSCFKVRINRLSPAPVITGQASSCFSIVHCPNTVTTQSAPVMTDADTTCILSAIDVRFTSTGVFGPGAPVNNYIAELSDTNGSFASPKVLGMLTTDAEYAWQLGSISGTIPANVPAGCGYYIRVRSTMPAVTGNTIGPYCLTQCDVLTNNQQDMRFCIPQLNNINGLCDSVKIQTNYWNNQASYDTCNDWRIELRSMMNFSLINSGGLGVYHDSAGGHFSLCMPPVREMLPVAPGEYYMRIVSNCSNLPWNQTGTVIRLTIGAPDTTLPVIYFDDSVVCNTALASAYVSPFNHPPSNYEWASNMLNNGNAFIWEFNPMLITLSNSPLPGTYVFYVREKNYGCYGPYSRATLLYVNGKPELNITGPDVVCPSDTVVYSTGYYTDTYYDWTTASTATILNEGNNQSGFVFNALGSYTIQNYAINECGIDSDTKDITVVQMLTATNGSYTLCADSTGTIEVKATQAIPHTLQTTGIASSAYRQGGMFNIMALHDVTIDSFAVKFTSVQPQQAAIYSKHGSYRTFEYTSTAWNAVGTYYNFPVLPQGQYTTVPITVNQSIAAGDTFAFSLSVLSSSTIESFVANGTPESVYQSDSNIALQHGTISNSAFGFYVPQRMLNVLVYYSTSTGLHYVWNTGDTTAAIQVAPAVNSNYTVDIKDDRGCSANATVQVTVIDCSTSVGDNQLIEHIIAVPNPTGGQLLIKGIKGPFTATVADVSGRELLKFNTPNTFLDISALPAGTYLLRVSADNRIFNTKIILQK